MLFYSSRLLKYSKNVVLTLAITFAFLVGCASTPKTTIPPSPSTTDLPLETVTATLSSSSIQAPITSEMHVTPKAGSTRLEGVSIQFQDIIHDDGTGGPRYEGENPSLIVVTSPGDAQKMSRWINAKAKSRLEQISYAKDFAVAVFQGWKPSGGYLVTIKGVYLYDDSLIVDGDFVAPEPNIAVSAMVTSPYHIIRVKREGLESKVTKFVLFSNGTRVLMVEQKI